MGYRGRVDPVVERRERVHAKQAGGVVGRLRVGNGRAEAPLRAVAASARHDGRPWAIWFGRARRAGRSHEGWTGMLGHGWPQRSREIDARGLWARAVQHVADHGWEPVVRIRDHGHECAAAGDGAGWIGSRNSSLAAQNRHVMLAGWTGEWLGLLR